MRLIKIKRLAKNLAALSIGCLIALVLLEVGLRLFNPIESRIRGDEIVLPVNKEYVIESSNIRGTDRTIVHRKNSIGFRGPDLPDNGLENHLSVIVIGGSTTECFFLSDDKDWPLVLYELLQGDFSPVWLNNAGLDGHSTFGHTILLRDIILDLKPKIALFMVGHNDVARKEGGKHTASSIKGSIRFDSLEGFIKSASAYSEVASVTLTIYRYLRAKSRGLPHRNLDIESLPHVPAAPRDLSEVLEYHINEFIPAYAQRLRAMVRLAKDAKIDPVFVTQPILYGAGKDPSTGVDLGTIIIDKKNTTGLEAWAILELYNEATRRIGKQEDVLTIDVANELEKNSDFYYDGIHFTNAGSEQVAKIIYKSLKPYLAENYPSFVKTGNSK